MFSYFVLECRSTILKCIEKALLPQHILMLDQGRRRRDFQQI